MLNILFKGLPERLRSGLAAYLNRYASGLSGTLNAEVSYMDKKELTLERNGDSCRITVHEDVHIFRALSKLIMNFTDEHFSFSETAYFDFIGPMFDFGQASAFLTVDKVKYLLLAFAAAGFDKFMIYTEDCLSVDGEPYFGYRRPRYTESELKEIDDFAYSLGIEVIPCVQTLSHLPGLMRHGKYRAFSDDEQTLLAGDERTYALVEKIISSATKPLRTKKIHIGLDEAWKLGQGKYLVRNGYVPKAEIFAKHVERVKEITDRLGLYAFMWDDMYFRAASPNNEYYIPVEEEPAVGKNGMVPPAGLGYIYWDYYHGYDYVKPTAEKHLRVFGDVFYAGAAVNTYGLGYMREFSERHGADALRACKDAGIRKVICCVWGDDSRESPPYAVLPCVFMYAEHAYSKEPEDDDVRSMFEYALGVSYDDVCAVSTIDMIPGYSDRDGNIERFSPARQALYQNVLLGMFDKNFENCALSEHFAEFSKRMTEAKTHTPVSSPFYGMFDFYEKLGGFLALKGELGIRLRRAYKTNDRAALEELSDKVIPTAERRMEAFYEAYRDFFFDNYKPWGFEVCDIRMGGVMGSLKTAKYRTDAYLDGVGGLSELDEEPLLFEGQEKVGSTVYADIATASIISKVL